MHQEILTEIGIKIRKIRQRKDLTGQELANRAGVSKGLISRIENRRTIPSLPVLISVIKALDVEVNTFFEDIDHSIGEPQIMVRRQTDLKDVKIGSNGFQYYPVIERSFPTQTAQISILDLKPDTKGEKETTDAFEFRYILEGEVDYEIANRCLTLQAGDSVYFDGNLGHIPFNRSTELLRILVIHFSASNR